MMQNSTRVLRRPVLSGAARLLFGPQDAGSLSIRSLATAEAPGPAPELRHAAPHQQTSWVAGAGGALGIAAAAFLVTPAAADAGVAPPPEVEVDKYAPPAPQWGGLPKRVQIYQYAVCPYCCKVKAALDYYQVPYDVIEVNPLTKKELKPLGFKKVPVLRVGDELINESSAIMSRLAVEAGQGSASSSSSSSASSSSTAAPAKRSVSKAAPASSSAPSSSGNFSEEETRWRKWVDDRFVKVVTANIYRSWSESVETFKYITDQTKWAWGTREVARWSGAVIMWQVGKGLPKKYSIEGDLRDNLYAECNAFVDAVGSRDFLGGAKPDLADLSVFGVLRAVALTPAFADAMTHSRVGPWYRRMEAAVGPPAPLPADDAAGAA